jgi:hypothetical protein
MGINESNFFVWYLAGQSPTASDLPRPYVLEPDALSPVVWLVPGETVSFYINSFDNTAISGALALIDERNVQNALAGSLSTIDFPDGQHTYGSLTVPALSEGFYRVAIGNYLTQWVWLTTAAKANRYSAVLKFRDEGRILGFRYGYLPDDFYQQFRVRIAVKGVDPSSNKEIYRESTTGKTVHSYSEPSKVLTFVTDEYNIDGHLAMAAVLEHDTILINGLPYAFNQPYAANMTEGDSLSRGEFSLSDERFSSIHRS